MSVARGGAWRVHGASVPYQFNKYNLPAFHAKVGERNLPAIGSATVLKKLDMEGRGLYRWRRRHRTMHTGWGKQVQQNKKVLYNVEWCDTLREKLGEALSHKALVLSEEMALMADQYGAAAVADVLTPPPEKKSDGYRNMNPWEHGSRPIHVRQYMHRIERDAPVNFLRPRGQHAYNLSFFPGKGSTTQVSE
eukprot:Rhum_TRINITY_DN21340_c0_g1::Rhum_TRINITY_DN21340_c0_g1_i1::g.173713::m.173713